MGTLAMIAAEAPKNLVHVVIDNEVYESTGSQRTISNAVALEKVAKSSGYRQAMRVDKKEDIKPAFEKMMNSEGPGFLLIKVEPCFRSENRTRDAHAGRDHQALHAVPDRLLAGGATSTRFIMPRQSSPAN